jgi:hypothetical protein
MMDVVLVAALVLMRARSPRRMCVRRISMLEDQVGSRQ